MSPTKIDPQAEASFKHLIPGLLYDLLVSGSPDHDPALPWQITVHVSQFPADTLLPCHTREHVESFFMSSLKEADQLKHSGKVNTIRYQS